MGVKWTEEQQKVINLRNRNILVSAAAGSGKTAVLVERIIQMLTDEKHPIDVDRLLIVTFTEAAAAEMKERVRNAIEKSLEENPENAHLQRQATLIHSASITTIHSFCLSVIREHFHVINLDPGFRIAEEGELKLLSQDVLGEVLESCYEEADETFLKLVEKLGSGRNDKRLETFILQLYEYSRSYPQPEKWLWQCVDNYAVNEQDGAYFIFEIAAKQTKYYVEDMLGILDEALAICEEADGPYMYAEMLEMDIEMLSNLNREQNEYEQLYQELTSIKWKALSRKKDESVSEEKKEKVKQLRDEVKKQVKDLIAAYYYEKPEEMLKDMEASHDTMQAFVALVQMFADAFAEKKRTRNLIDFNDMEQFALQILTEEKEGKLVPSIVAQEYQEQFAEVMIDEYQDSNLIQEAILTSVSTISKGKYNVFMVGDVKQSIYRFRLSRPELFMEKYENYSLEDGEKQRIDLHKNFRSRAEVLDSTNYIFERIMRRELGGVEYDENAALYLGADYETLVREDGSLENETELLLLDTSDAEIPDDLEEGTEFLDGTGKQLEAQMVAKRIKELVGKARVKDKETGEYRPAQYRDIVILSRSAKGWSDIFSTILNEEGIPAYAGSREGYFETYEVSVLLDYLQLLDNQRQDVPLAAVLTSPFVGLSAQELAEIRNSKENSTFYEAAEQSERLQEFYRQLEHFRKLIPYTSIHELLWKILEETGYGVYISAMPGGAQRKANLEMLIEKACSFEGTSYKGLFNFVRYIEQLKKYDVDYGEANIIDEQADTVRIMTIHKSKGLEFPIVFVVGMGKRFNMQDVNGSMIIHPELGVGIDQIDLDRRTKIPTFLKKMIQQQTKLETLGEELRVLYVALTRAKEKLIMTGQLKDARNLVLQYENAAIENASKGGMTFSKLASAHKYLDWVLPVAAQPDAPISIKVWDYWDAAVLDKREEQAEQVAKDILEHWNLENVYDNELKEHLNEQFSYRYPYQQMQKWKMKFTVSELKKRTYLSEDGSGENGEEMIEEAPVVPLLPKFLQEEEEIKGASRGSVYHKVLELLDFTQEYNTTSLKEAIRQMEQDKIITKEMTKCIRIKDIQNFLNSNIGKRMQKAAKSKLLKTEQPFVLGVDAGAIYREEIKDACQTAMEDMCQKEVEDVCLSDMKNEMILVQGIIDVYFEEDGEIVLLDYKTDKVRNGAELKERYHAQLEYYAKALEQLLGKKVKEKVIYSFCLGEKVAI